MRRSSAFVLGITLSIAALSGTGHFYIATNVEAEGTRQEVYVGGMPAGFTLNAGGAQVIGVTEIMSESGVCSPALDAGLKTGDLITKAAGITVGSVEELNEILNKSGGKDVELCVRRGEETLTLSLKPVKDKVTNRYKIGVLIRDSVSGIGTLTYIDKETKRFGALGHAVVGEDKQTLKISDGKVYQCSIMSISKGIRGRAGELRGMFLNDEGLGTAEKICDIGIYGHMSDSYNFDSLQTAQIADIEEVKPGGAYIYSTVSGICPKSYTVDIVKVDKNNKSNKNFVIKITDKELIEETGGIVQGMSGSPILQDGKLVGAVTHVFLNDPTRGYGIDINTMLDE